MRWLPLLSALALVACNNEEECTDWFCEDGTASTGTATGKGTGKGTGKTGTKTGDYLALSAELSASTGLGTLYATGSDCESSAEVASAQPDTTCAGCDFAWVLTLGPLNADASPCPDGALYLSDTLQIGHSDPDTLWFGKGSWEAGDGFVSAVTGDDWDWGVDK